MIIIKKKWKSYIGINLTHCKVISVQDTGNSQGTYKEVK
jgi:hypothetical protein